MDGVNGGVYPLLDFGAKFGRRGLVELIHVTWSEVLRPTLRALLNGRRYSHEKSSLSYIIS